MNRFFLFFCFSSFFLRIESLKLKIKEQQKDPQNLSTFLILNLSNNLLETPKWENQWTIGNGRFGGLIGGSTTGDIIPLSLSDFYTIEGKQNKKTSQGENTGQSKYKQFKSSRELLITGNFQESQSKLSSLISQTSLGMFQYICDLLLIFSSSSITSTITPPQQQQQQTYQAKKSQVIGREKIWKDFNQLLNIKSFGKVLQSTNSLDVKLGITKQIIISQPIKSISTNLNLKLDLISHYVHSRAWYASSIDDVIVGKLKCRTKCNSQNTENYLGDNCLHFGLRLSRHTNKNGLLMSETGWNIQPWSEVVNKYHFEEGSDNQNKNNEQNFGAKKIRYDKIIALDLSLQSSFDIYHSGAEMCAVIMCLTSSSKGNDQSGIYFSFHTFPIFY